MTKKKHKAAGAAQPVSYKKPVKAATNPAFEKHPFLIAAMLIMAVACFVFKDYLFGDKVYLFKDIGSDTLNALYPGFCLYADYLQHYGFPSWSFAFGIGQNLLPFFLRDPTDLFLYFAGRDHIASLIAWREFAKVVAGGFIFYAYLRLVVKDGFAAVAGALMFSFCSFMILAGGWYIFSFEAITVALLLLSFEMLFQKNEWWLFPVPIALIGISQPFNLYVYGLFLMTYLLLRFYEEGKDHSVKSLGLLLGKMAALAMIGIMMAAVFLLPNVIQLLESPRGSGLTGFTSSLRNIPVLQLAGSAEFKTAVSRFFSGDLMGTASDFSGWYNYLEAPEFYCGILALVALPLGIANAERRRRIAYLIFLGAWLLPVLFPFLRHAFWLFTGDYYRGYSFCVSIILIYLAARSLSMMNAEGRQVNFPVLGATTLLLLVAVSATTPADIKEQPIFMITVTLILLYAFFLMFLPSARHKPMAQYALLAILALELSYMGSTTTSDRAAVKKAELKQRTGYNDYTAEAVTFLKNADPSFFRIDKNYASSPAIHFSVNDAMVQKYYGTSQYNSFNQLNYVRALAFMKVIDPLQEAQTRWLDGTRNHPLLENIFSVKYLLRNDALSPQWNFQFDSLAHFGNVTAVRNKFSLPLGFAYNRFMLQSDFNKISRNYTDVALLYAFLIPDSAEKQYPSLQKLSRVDTTAFNVDVYTAAIDSLKRDTLTLTAFSQTRLEGRIKLLQDEMLLLSMPYDKGWSAIVNGIPQQIAIVNGGLMGLLLKQGENNVVLYFQNRYFGTTLLVTACGMALFLIAGGLQLWRRRKQRSFS